MGSTRKDNPSPSTSSTSYSSSNLRPCQACISEQEQEDRNASTLNADDQFLAALERDTFEYALKSNEAWANYKGHQNPAFFEKLAAGQSPSILWLGCSDSRVPETTLLGMQPGDVFVHRNIANIISPTDINSMSVIEYAVVHLKVKHVVLCGHTACGGANAALGDARIGGVIDTWITPLKMLRKTHAEELKAITDDGKRAWRLAELNVEAGVNNLMSNYVIEEAIEKRGLSVHGIIYDVACGKIKDLKVGTCTNEKGAGAAQEEHVDVVKGNHGMLVFGGEGASMAVR